MKKFIKSVGICVSLGILISGCVAIKDVNSVDRSGDSDTQKILLPGSEPFERPDFDMACAFMAGSSNLESLCYMRDATDPNQYRPTACNVSRRDHSWVKAIGNNMNGRPSNIWVLVADDDPHFSMTSVSWPGQSQRVYSPNLIHNAGVITGHRACDLPQEIQSTCPVPGELPRGGTGCVLEVRAPNLGPGGFVQ